MIRAGLCCGRVSRVFALFVVKCIVVTYNLSEGFGAGVGQRLPNCGLSLTTGQNGRFFVNVVTCLASVTNRTSNWLR